jgi:hypothetical protein
MSERLITIPKTTLQNFLRPISRLTESCVLKAHDNMLYTVCTNQDNSLILYGKIEIPTSVEETKLNIINIKKLITGLSCLGDNGEFSLVLKENHIVCKILDIEKNESSHFKYHLVDNGIIKESPVSIQKIANLNFDTEFEISNEKIKKIISAYSFASDASKIYFYSSEGKIWCEINDRTIQNIDNMTMVLSDNFIGSEILIPKPVSIELFKRLLATNQNIKVKYGNETNVFIFQTQNDNGVELKYIVSALVK